MACIKKTDTVFFYSAIKNRLLLAIPVAYAKRIDLIL